MKKRLFLINTVNQFMEMIFNPFAKPFMEQYPEIEVFNICDDSLLVDTLNCGHMPNDVAARILNYVLSAERAGACAVMITCTSVSEAAIYARRFAKVPVFSIIEPMVKMAVDSGEKIGILGTLPTSPLAIVPLMQEHAKLAGKKIEIITKVAEGAYDKLVSGDVKKHDEMVNEALAELAGKVDAVTFAQISMSKLVLKDCGKPVFKIGKSGFDEAARILEG
ncbi:MAG TPA: aspartate/glutamate racemase family protein [Clostridiaceae bacterium]|nr:aspartate/glutamate racemase family protein [Clostridiaceae bacterium]